MSTLAEARPAAISAPVKEAPGQRIMSVDALRGFDMFWILGADALVGALNRMSQTPPTRFLAYELDHADWQGFHFYDLIFPLFVFIVGVSTVFSLSKTLQTEGRGEALKRVFRRGILLFIVGLFYSGGFSNPWPDMRLMGVLNRIALAYLFTGVLFCFFRPRAMALICAGLLAGYWAVMSFTPIRDIQLTKENLAGLAEISADPQTAAVFRDAGRSNPSTNRTSVAWQAAEKMFYGTTQRVSGKFGKGYNVSDHFDFQFLPGKLWDNFFDPEGFLSTIPAVATCLLGVFAGLLLRSQSVDDRGKVVCLFGAGVAAVCLGWLWNLEFPVIKKIWTSSFVLVAGGYSALLLGAFYLVVDVWKYQKWCQPFVWIGMNSITIYLTKNILGGSFNRVASRFAGGDIKAFFDTHLAQGAGELMISIVGLLIAFGIVYFLYRRKIFLRL
jgi:predicted acyltransferase